MPIGSVSLYRTRVRLSTCFTGRRNLPWQKARSAAVLGEREESQVRRGDQLRQIAIPLIVGGAAIAAFDVAPACVSSHATFCSVARSSPHLGSRRLRHSARRGAGALVRDARRRAALRLVLPI